jgi:Ni/Co efflux regulator RcnB
MIKSKSMTVAAAALAMCLAGSAFAQDRRDGDRDGRRDGPRAEQNQDRGQGRDFDRRGGHGDRGDRGFRGDYREGRQFDRPGYPSPHSEWRRGGRVPSEYRGRSYVVDDWRGHHLQQPQRGYQWVGVGGDYVLAAIATGLIAQIIVGQ